MTFYLTFKSLSYTILLNMCCYHFDFPHTVAIIRTDPRVTHYNVTERLDDAVWIPLILMGQKGPGRDCVVEVRTMDGSASGMFW